MKTHLCRLINNFYNRRFRVEVCRMKEAIIQQCEYFLSEGVHDDQRVHNYFVDLHLLGYSDTYIDAIFTQASAELEHLT